MPAPTTAAPSRSPGDSARAPTIPSASVRIAARAGSRAGSTPAISTTHRRLSSPPSTDATVAAPPADPRERRCLVTERQPDRHQPRPPRARALGSVPLWPPTPSCAQRSSTSTGCSTLLVGLREAGFAVATASASQNAGRLLAAVSLPDGRSLRSVLDADVSGLDGPGKPDPAIFLEAARRLGREPEECLVVEDAPAGVEAARRGGMPCVAVDRSDDAAALSAKGADLVLDRLDRLEPAALLDRLAGR